ncbi:IclR family transcriptional regulator C-terminal domain-containing protein [uncultured Roseibium sp.]|uniref:IclR family transcriptional regulator domain-containing protein n=1 Tax=uncultured Roseibium sp. TaxID=1936171 RepID=UPI0032173071
MSDDQADSDRKPRDFVASLEHGLDVLGSFDAASPAMSLTQVADRTGMNRASARRYLLTLAHLGYVSRDGRAFRLAPKVLQLGYSYLSALPFSAFAQPLLDEASAISGQTVALAVRDGDVSVYTARAIAQRSLAVTVPVGRRLPLLSTSTGRAMLAFDPAEQIDALIESSQPILLTDKTNVDPNLLRRELELVRNHGYALVEQEVEVGVRSLAVPFFDNNQRVAGAITALTSMSAVTTKQLLSDILPVVQNVADQMQIALKAGRTDINS